MSDRPSMPRHGARLSESAPNASTTQPGPVIPVEQPEASTEELEPEPQERKPGSVSWTSDGTVRIRDLDAAGGSFSCMWTVEYDELLLREGRWRTLIGPVRATCGGQRITVRDPDDPNPRTVWTVRLRGGGDRLIVNAGTPARIRLERVSREPLRYRGRRQPLTYRLKVVNSERMTGAATARQRYNGRDCTFRRSLRMTYIGE